MVRKFGVALALTAAIWVQSLEGQSVPPDPAVSRPADTVLTVNTGEKLLMQLETPLHTRSTKEGDLAHFRTTGEIMAGNRVAIPRGSTVRATVTKVQRPGRLKGRAEIGLRFDEVGLPDGTKLPFSANLVRAGFNTYGPSKDGEPRLKGEAGSKGSVLEVAQGGLQGAILGAAMGGARGAAYGSAAGAAIGLAGVLLKRGPELDLPPNMMFEIVFDRPLDIPSQVALRAEQMARTMPPPSPSSSIPNSPPRPRMTRRGEEKAEPVPDFSKDTIEPPRPVESAETAPETTTIRDSIPPPAPEAAKSTSPVFTESDGNDSAGFKLSVNVQLVMVDATVKDRSGRPLDKLTQKDFHVYEDGVEQEIRNFSRDEFPLAVALVIDRSGSVAPHMNDLRRAAYQALQQLKRGDQVALFSFAGEVERLEELTTDRQRIADRIATIRGGGGTNIIDALFDATYYLAQVAPDRRRAVLLISDNVNTTKPRTSEGQVIRMALESETVIHSVKTPGEFMPLTMRIPNWLGGAGSVDKITEETGGEIIDVTGLGSFDAALSAAINRLKLRYTLGYYPTNTVRDGSFRKIDVRLAERFGRPASDYSVYSRRGYYSATDRAAARSNP